MSTKAMIPWIETSPMVQRSETLFKYQASSYCAESKETRSYECDGNHLVTRSCNKTCNISKEMENTSDRERERFRAGRRKTTASRNG